MTAEEINNIVVPTNWATTDTFIKVIGVGGGGCNAVNTMFNKGIKEVEFVISNTDGQSLENIKGPKKIYIGDKGIGAGCDPNKGRQAATESIEKFRKELSDKSEMVFITAGMGGGTGTGATPIIAQIAKEMGKLTVGVVTLPFRDEGESFLKRALIGIQELQKHVDSLLIIDNQKLYQIFGAMQVWDAFPRADEVLYTAIKSIADIVTTNGLINVDLADVRMVMKDSGMAIMGIGTASGPDRAVKAVEMAFDSPLLNDCNLMTSTGVLVNITSGKENGLTMSELSQIMDYVKSYTGSPAKFKRGLVIDPNMEDEISISIVATGFSINSLPQISIGDDSKVVLAADDDVYNQDLLTNYSITLGKPSEERNESSIIEDYKYVAQEGKPSLILEPGDDIVKLENEPAYIRRNRKINS